MQKISLIIVLLIGIGGGALIAAEKSAEKTPATKPADTKGPAINKICAVEGGDKTVDPDFFTIYKGMKIGFCCEDCAKSFAEEPEKYIAKLKARKDGIK